MEKVSYPKWKYHADYSPEMVESKEQEKSLGAGWVDSPASYGVETCPAKMSDFQAKKKAQAVKS